MPESTGVVTFEDVLLWAAEQGAFTTPCGTTSDDAIRLAVRRVEEVVRASTTPRSMRNFDGDGQRVDAFIDHLLQPRQSGDNEAACLDQQLRMDLEHLIGAYGWSVADGFQTPLHPRVDIAYVCQHEIGDTTPPAWALDYFDDLDDPSDRAQVVVEIEGDAVTHTFVARTTDGSPLADEEVIRQTEEFVEGLDAGTESRPTRKD